MTTEFEKIIGSIEGGKELLTPKVVNSDVLVGVRRVGKGEEDGVKIEVIDGDIVVAVSRAISAKERRYLKENGFRMEDGGRSWLKSDDGSIEAVKSVFVTQSQSLWVQRRDIDIEEVYDQAMSKGSANEVFAEFSKKAAAMKVVEMVGAIESSDRQRAQETVLGYALGKPVERTISLHANIANMSKEELIDKIREKLAIFGSELGIEGAVRGHTLLIDDGGRSEGGGEAEGLQAESGVSGEVFKEPS